MTNEERAKNLRKEIEKTANTILCKYDKAEVSEKVQKYIDIAIQSGIKGYLGINSTWNTLEVSSDSPLKNYIDQACKKAIDNLKLNPIEIILTEKEINCINRIFNSTYKAYLKEKIRKAAAKKVEEDFEEISKIIKRGNTNEN